MINEIIKYIEKKQTVIKLKNKQFETDPLIMSEHPEAPPPGTQRIAKISLEIMKEAKIPSIFKAHSIRGASVSKAIASGIPEYKVRIHARLTDAVMRKHYLRIESEKPGIIVQPNPPISHALRIG